MKRLVSTLALFAATSFVIAARADDFPAPFNTEPKTDVPLMSPADAVGSLRMPEGFQATLFAAEPDVQNPIDMAWDSKGRMWVAENYTYAERSQKFQLDLRDRVVVLEDTDGDGRHDKRTVFTDNVQMLTSVEVGHGGVWLMCPPQVLFIPDADHDLVPDGPAKVVLDGFTVAKQNYHNFANGLRFGPDGWLYGRCGGSCPGRIGKPGTPDDFRFALEGGIWRYHPRRQTVEVLTAGTTNPWGHDWDENGNLFFINTVNGHLWHGIPGAHFTRPFTLDPNRRTYELIDFHADHWHFDTGQSWTKSRDGAANDFGGGHAHSGLMIYQADNWPAEYRGELFTLNFHGRRINQETIKPNGCGYVASHNPDPILSDDPWFRGMDLRSGPDGGVYVLDWSDIGECHEHTGVHRTSGRIFKITHSSGKSTAPQNDLRALSSNQLARLNENDNVWHARQAHLILAERTARGDDVSSAVTVFETQLASKRPRAQIRVLLGLVSTGATNTDMLIKLLDHANEHVRAWAVRLLTDDFPIDDCFGPVTQTTAAASDIRRRSHRLLPDLCRRAESDTSGIVRLTLASTLQRLPVEHRSQLAAKLVAHSEDAGDHNQPLMIWYGLMPVAEHAPADLVDVAAVCKLPTALRLITRRLCEDLDDRPQLVNKLIKLAAETNDATWRKSVITGIVQAMQGWQKAEQPKAWEQLVAATNDKSLREQLRSLSVVFGDGRALAEVRQVALDDNASSSIRLTALETLIASEPDDLQDICIPLLRDARMNMVAVQGLAKIDSAEVGRAIVQRYNNFRAPNRPRVVSILSSRKPFARAMLAAVEKGKIPRADLTAFDVRQIHALGDEQISKMVGEVWGEIHETEAAKVRTIANLKSKLTPTVLSKADHRAGRKLFIKSCQNCHRLYGEGGKVGPDLTGANRSNLDYLLSNIVDPSGVVDKDFRMTLLLLDDGRVISGLVTQRTEKTVQIQTATEMQTIAVTEIESEKITEKSPMPEGLIDTLSPEQIKNLIGYLAHPGQVALDD